MITFRIATDVTDDRRVVLTLPAEVPTGKAELVVTIASPPAQEAKPPRTSLADWAEAHAEPATRVEQTARPLPQGMGKYHSGQGDVSEKARDILRQAVKEGQWP